MKRIFCPKCDRQLTFDETKYPDGKILVFVCPGCTHQFKTKLGRKVVRTESGQDKEEKEPDFSYGYITVIENQFGYKQHFPLVLGDNIIGRRNKDTEGVTIPIITADPSVGRKHCIVNVKMNKNNELKFSLRDFPSLTGTFLNNVLLGKKEQAFIYEGDVISIGATTFILHESGDPENSN